MFFEENEITDILKCSRCKERLDEPTMLPCGDTVCSLCLKLIHASNKKFKCIVCNNEHTMPENGLPINKALRALWPIQPKEVYRSQAVETLKETLNTMRKKISLLQTASDNSSDRIKDECIELRRQVQLATDQVIEQINDFNDQFINVINQYENETIESLQSNNRQK